MSDCHNKEWVWIGLLTWHPKLPTRKDLVRASFARIGLIADPLEEWSAVDPPDTKPDSEVVDPGFSNW